MQSMRGTQGWKGENIANKTNTANIANGQWRGKLGFRIWGLVFPTKLAVGHWLLVSGLVVGAWLVWGDYRETVFVANDAVLHEFLAEKVGLARLSEPLVLVVEPSLQGQVATWELTRSYFYPQGELVMGGCGEIGYRLQVLGFREREGKNISDRANIANEGSIMNHQPLTIVLRGEEGECESFTESQSGDMSWELLGELEMHYQKKVWVWRVEK